MDNRFSPDHFEHNDEMWEEDAEGYNEFIDDILDEDRDYLDDDDYDELNFNE